MKLGITHFYNEEKLLPFWLKHHKGIFDHVVLIDHHSTDRSVEIIREICPNWEVRESRNLDFNAINTDFEVMCVESEFEADWKIALNTTEFLVTKDLSRAEAHLRANQSSKVVVSAVMIVDKERKDPDPDTPLIDQYPYGMWDSEICYRCIPERLRLMKRQSRSRIIHNALVGAYTPGRHRSHLENALKLNRTEAYIAWFAYAPASGSYLQRKLQIQTRIPKSDIQARHGAYHLIDETLLEEQIAYLSSHAWPIAVNKPKWRIYGAKILGRVFKLWEKSSTILVR